MDFNWRVTGFLSPVELERMGRNFHSAKDPERKNLHRKNVETVVACQGHRYDFIRKDEKVVDVQNFSIPFIIVSQDNAVTREWYWSGNKYREIIDIDGIDFKRLNSVFYNHDLHRSLPIAKTKNVRKEGNVLKAEVEFDPDDDFSMRVYRKVKNDFIRGSSIGYKILDYHYNEGNGENILDEMIITRCEVFELSITPIPADVGAQKGRSYFGIPPMGITTELQEVRTPMENNSSMLPSVQSLALTEERKRADELLQLGQKYAQFKGVDLAHDCIREGKSVGEFKAVLLERMGAIRPRNPMGPTGMSNSESEFKKIGLSEKEKEKYSLSRLLRSMIEPHKYEAGFEAECSGEVAKMRGKQPKGLYIPYDVLAQRREGLLSAFAEKEAYFAHDFRPSSFLDILREKLLLAKLGLQIFGDAQGEIVIPKKTLSSNAIWVGDTEDIKDSELKTGIVTLRPKTVAASLTYSRRMIINANPSVENLIFNDLAASMAEALDQAALTGRGGEIEPKGILNGTGPSLIKMGEMVSMEEIEEFVTRLEENKVDIEKAVFLTHPRVKKLLKTTSRTEKGEKFILDNNRILDQTYISTGYMPSASLLLGVFEHLMFALWSGVDVIVNPFEKSRSAQTVVHFFQDADIAVRYPEAFAYCNNIPIKPYN